MRNASVATGVLVATLSIPGCFNPDANADGDGDGTTVGASDTGATPDSTGGTSCTPDAAEDCTCTDGSSGTRTCNADGTGFGQCVCPGTDTSADGGTSTTSGPGPECVDDDGCDALDDACNDGVCNDAGTCVAMPHDAGTPCGSMTATACDAPDVCDGKGACSSEIAAQGVPCTGCGETICACDGGGACGPCTVFADSNGFNTPRSIVGWDLTGGWGLYDAAPQSASFPTVPFASRVFGTDGNLRHPYPNAETESSTATSVPFVLPATLTFSSWHVDEGGGGCSVDRKGVFASIDGGASWTPIVDCCTPGLEAPFCDSFASQRPADQWDLISAPVPAELVGMPGQIQFRYDTLDECCGFEQGWFVDTASIAPECACGVDETCDGLGGECGAGVCGDDGQCTIDAVAVGTSCGDPGANTCSAPDACNAAGACSPSDIPNGKLPYCDFCPLGATCGGCVDGTCVDCPSGEIDVLDANSWVATANEGTDTPGWGYYYAAPPDNQPGSVAESFGARGPVIGTDGNRIAPYPAAPANAQFESSSWVTTAFTVPAAITFESWNLDEGGAGNYDNKIIELSVDGGVSWNVLADCSGGSPYPFCVGTIARSVDAWDLVSIDTSTWQGMTGQLRLSYDSQDACCETERGWFINDLNVLSACIDQIPQP